MLRARPSRLPHFDYKGFHRYHVRICTWSRRPLFDDAAVVCAARSHLLLRAPRHGIAICAYCFMRDHVHVLMQGDTPDASATQMVDAWKQKTAYWYSRRRGDRLWQPGYFDRVLRENEGDAAVARYIVENPIRAALPARFRCDPYVWCLYDEPTLYADCDA
jgi:putative transposase